MKNFYQSAAPSIKLLYRVKVTNMHIILVIHEKFCTYIVTHTLLNKQNIKYISGNGILQQLHNIER